MSRHIGRNAGAPVHSAPYAITRQNTPSRPATWSFILLRHCPPVLRHQIRHISSCCLAPIAKHEHQLKHRNDSRKSRPPLCAPRDYFRAIIYAAARGARCSSATRANAWLFSRLHSSLPSDAQRCHDDTMTMRLFVERAMLPRWSASAMLFEERSVRSASAIGFVCWRDHEHFTKRVMR